MPTLKWLALIAFCLGSLTFFVLVGGAIGALLGIWLGEKAPPIAHILIVISTACGALTLGAISGIWIWRLASQAFASGEMPNELMYLQIPLVLVILVGVFSGASSMIRDFRKPTHERVTTAIWNDLLIKPGQLPPPFASEAFDTHGVWTRYPDAGFGLLNEIEQPNWRIHWDQHTSTIHFYNKIVPSSLSPALPADVSLKQGRWPSTLRGTPQEGEGPDYWLEMSKEATAILKNENPIKELIQIGFQLQAM